MTFVRALPIYLQNTKHLNLPQRETNSQQTFTLICVLLQLAAHPSKPSNLMHKNRDESERALPII